MKKKKYRSNTLYHPKAGMEQTFGGEEKSKIVVLVNWNPIGFFCPLLSVQCRSGERGKSGEKRTVGH